MTYRQAVEFLLGFTDYEKLPSFLYSPADFDLGRMRGLMARLGDPHRALPTVHIAGTKGKGSTAAMVAWGLAFSGYRTGLYTSPHLHHIRERIRVDGRPISPRNFSLGVGRLKVAIEGMEYRDKLTTFELLTALALDHFARKGVEVQVLEVGLGGRLDATNIVEPLVAVVTSLSLDHTALLGTKVEDIAREKGGIIKPGATVVSAPQPPAALRVLEGICRERGASLTLVGRDITWGGGEASLRGQALEVLGRRGRYQLFIPLLGAHQQENAATAVAVLEALTPHFPRITAESLARGMAEVSWPGRLQVLQETPLVVVDGAHNADSAGRLREAVLALFPGRRPVLVFGTSVDKDIEGMARELSPLGARVLVAASRHPRAAATEKVAGVWEKYQACEGFPSVPRALEEALARALPTDLILATGSLFVVAEAVEYLRRKKGASAEPGY
ncbi:MAG: folylpolyglutamate synthase/dihydrofolate synthase family protein [Chloroflexota bacterium]